MNNNIDKLYDNFKTNSDISNEYKKEIDTIDSCLKGEDVDVKKEILIGIENKYKEKLDARGYFKIKDLVDSKSYMVNNKKELNTLLGNLKLWLVRLAYLDKNKSEEADRIYTNIVKEKDIEKMYKLLDKADGILI